MIVNFLRVSYIVYHDTISQKPVRALHGKPPYHKLSCSLAGYNYNFFLVAERLLRELHSGHNLFPALVLAALGLSKGLFKYNTIAEFSFCLIQDALHNVIRGELER